MTHPKATTAIKNLGLELSEYTEFIGELESSLKKLLLEAKNSLLKKDGLEASESIHSIKGNVGSLGFTDSHKFCQTLEASFKKGVDENSMGMLDEFINIYNAELKEIKETL